GEELQCLKGHEAMSQYHAFSGNGKVLVSGSLNRPSEEFPVRVFDLTTGKQLAKLKLEVGTVGVAASADGSRVAAVAYANSGGKPSPWHVAVVWDVASGKEL